MNSEQERKAKMAAERQQVEKELGQAQAVAVTAARELGTLREQERNANRRLQSLREAVDNLRGPAEIVLLSEYGKMKELIAENEAILALYGSQAEAAKLKGTTAAKRAEDLTSKLSKFDKELSTHGKIIPFPYSAAAVDLTEDQEPDDDDD
jgi:hypothetical protein